MSSKSEPICECQGDWGLFIWRGDPDWWSCVACDQRVRPLTVDERAARNYPPVETTNPVGRPTITQQEDA